ncbi:MAG: hypothetical protein SF123_13840 [Chloroflexota bacterium]|nr:hypothetical protein [Chloroflexota bacterium]
MTKSYDLYGFTLDTIEIVARKLEVVLEVQFERRNSSFLSEYYVSGKSNGENFQLLFNRNDEDEDAEGEAYWHEPEFKSYPVILRVNKTNRSKELQEIILKSHLPGVILLRANDVG